ncbi:MAG: hypothetical protein J5529_12210 [Prevotella sp.]|nr:hypothetical protein [Prevotella sp.]
MFTTGCRYLACLLIECFSSFLFPPSGVFPSVQRFRFVEKNDLKDLDRFERFDFRFARRPLVLAEGDYLCLFSLLLLECFSSFLFPPSGVFPSVQRFGFVEKNDLKDLDRFVGFLAEGDYLCVSLNK